MRPVSSPPAISLYYETEHYVFMKLLLEDTRLPCCDIADDSFQVIADVSQRAEWFMLSCNFYGFISILMAVFIPQENNITDRTKSFFSILE